MGSIIRLQTNYFTIDDLKFAEGKKILMMSLKTIMLVCYVPTCLPIKLVNIYKTAYTFTIEINSASFYFFLCLLDYFMLKKIVLAINSIKPLEKWLPFYIK